MKNFLNSIFAIILLLPNWTSLHFVSKWKLRKSALNVCIIMNTYANCVVCFFTSIFLSFFSYFTFYFRFVDTTWKMMETQPDAMNASSNQRNDKVTSTSLNSKISKFHSQNNSFTVFCLWMSLFPHFPNVWIKMDFVATTALCFWFDLLKCVRKYFCFNHKYFRMLSKVDSSE